MIGKIISHYRILEKLGEGGMGVVYKAEDTELQRVVALKFLPAEFTRNHEAKQRFKKEARAASQLDHPRIGTIYEIKETDEGHMYIAMAYYEGETLKDVIKRGPLKVKQAIELVMQVANGLATAHDKDITHRDIKPANIIITKEGFVKIVDFGLAKLGDTTKITKSGTTMGTPAYMSPEQVKGKRVDHRCDLWALSIIFYELLTGRLPFVGDNEMTMMYNIVNEPAPPVSQFNTEVPAQVEKLIQKSLRKTLENRYQSMVDFIKDLKQIHLQHFRAEETILLDNERIEQQQLSPTKSTRDTDRMKTIAITDRSKKTTPKKRKKSKLKPVLTLAVLLTMIVLGVMNAEKIKGFFETDSVPGYLKIDSQPQGAVISVDGEESGKTTPAVLGPLDNGVHKLSLAAAGFETWSKDLTVAANDTLVEMARLRPAQPQLGSLEINSKPEGAAIFFDDVDIGQQTPATLANLSVGEHMLRLTKEGYELFEQSINISSKKMQSLSASLTKLAPEKRPDKTTKPKRALASLLVESQPKGALISLNGKATGRKTPYRFTNLKAGKYKIVLSLAGYEDQQQNQTVNAGVKSRIRIPLKVAAPGFLFVRSFVLENGAKRRDASRIDVYVDGVLLGLGYVKHEVKSGIHTLNAKKEGYKLQNGKRQIKIISGQQTKIELIFIKEE